MNNTFSRPRHARLYSTAILMLCAVACLSACSESQDKRLTDAITRLKAPYTLSVGETSGAPDQPAVLKNVAFTLPSEDGPIAVTMESVTAEGIQYENLFGSATLPLIEKIVITGLKATRDDYEYTAERYEFDGFSANPETLAADLAGYFKSGVTFCEFLGTLILPEGETPGMDTVMDSPDFSFSAKRFMSTGDRSSAPVEGGTIVLFFETTEISGFTSRKHDSLISRAMWGEYNGKRFFSAAELGAADIVFSPDGTGAQANGEIILGVNPMDGDYRIGEIHMKGLTFTPLTAARFPFTVENITFSADFTDARQAFTATVAGFSHSREALASYLAAVPYGAQFRGIIPSLPETLTADAAVSMDIQPLQNGGAALSVKPFSVSLKDLASFSISVDAQGEFTEEGTASVGLVDMTLTDNGLSDILFAFVGEQQGKTGLNLRQETRMQFSAAMFSLQGTLAELCTNILDFLEKPGATLNIKIQPPAMIDPETMGVMIMSDPDSVGVSSTLTRDGKQ